MAFTLLFLIVQHMWIPDEIVLDCIILFQATSKNLAEFTATSKLRELIISPN